MLFQLTAYSSMRGEIPVVLFTMYANGKTAKCTIEEEVLTTYKQAEQVLPNIMKSLLHYCFIEKKLLKE
jgi:hypothetical protein